MPHADGGHVWVSARSVPQPDGTIISAYTQITEAEAKARETARVGTLVDDSPDMVWMFDGHGLIEYASPSFSAALGMRQDEVLGRLWRALTHPLDVPALRAALADAGPDNPRTKIIELRLRASDGSWVWVEGQATLRFRGGQRDRGRDHRPRRHPHARRGGRGPAAGLAAEGARRRRALRHPDARPVPAHRGRQRVRLLAAGPDRAPGRARRQGVRRRHPRPRAPARRPRGRRSSSCARSPTSARPHASSPSSAPTGGASASTTSRSATTAPRAGCGPSATSPSSSSPSRSSASSWRR